MIGQRFGRLVVQEMTSKRLNGLVSYKCRCDCGNTKYTTGAGLRVKRRPVRSCGCLQKERASQTQTKDITNQRFGLLVALEPIIKRGKYGYVKWKCKCDCGNIKILRGSSLRAGQVKSCGCLLYVSRFIIHTNIDMMDVPIEIINCLKAYYELRKAIKQAS